LAVGPPVTDAGSPQRGYHPIASWFVAIDLCDELTLAALPPGTPGRLSVRWADDAPKPTQIDWPVERDLAMRAHSALAAAVGRPLPAEMRLLKRIPVGAGMGGGSSDCAAALIGLNSLFSLGFSAERLAEIARPLGSDIAFFLDDPALSGSPPRSALVGGFGDRIERINPPAPHPLNSLVLIVPPFGCPTGAVYQTFDTLIPPGHALREGDARALVEHARRHGLTADAPLFNDLEPAAARVAPELGRIIAALRAAAIPVHLTGSGSTLFVLAPAAAAADVRDLRAQIERVLAAEAPAARTLTASILA
jgi:4-diphosphocytidyl-2-C-methyl-D-erythritol kinase